MNNGNRPTFHNTTIEELYQVLPSENKARLSEFSRLTGVAYGSVYYPYLVCCEYYLYLLTTLLNELPKGQQIQTLITVMQNHEHNISAMAERVQVAMDGVVSASNPNGVARNLAVACTVTGLFAFVTGVAVTNWLGPRDEAMKIYYLNQQAISKCQQKFKSKSGVIKCPNPLVVPSK